MSCNPDGNHASIKIIEADDMAQKSYNPKIRRARYRQKMNSKDYRIKGFMLQKGESISILKSLDKRKVF